MSLLCFKAINMASNYILNIIVKGRDEASGAIGGVTGSLKKMGEIAGGVLIAKGAEGLFNLGKSVLGLAADAGQLVGIEQAFAGMAESVGRGASDMLAALKKGSGGMIANRDLMLSFNKAAQLVNRDFATKLPDAMQYLGKVSASTGADLDYLLDSLVTGVGRLSPMILDNLAIQVDMTAAQEAYAASVGKTVDELTKTEKQTALMNQVIEKLAQNTAGLPDVAGSASAQMANLGVEIQNAKDEIGKAFLPVLGILMPKLTELAMRTLPLVTKAARAFADVLVAFLSGSPGDFPWEDIFPPWLANVMYSLSGHFKELRDNIIALYDYILYFVRSGDYLNDALADMTPGLRAVIQPLGLLISLFAEFVSKHSDEIRAVFEGIVDAVVKSGLLGALVTLGKVLLSLTSPFGVVSLLVGLLLKSAPDLEGAIKKLFKAFEFLLKGDIDGVLEALWEALHVGLGISEDVTGAIVDLVEWLWYNIPVAVEAAMDAWNNILLPALQAVASFIVDVLLAVFETVRGWFSGDAPEAMGQTSNFITGTLIPAFLGLISWVQENLPIFIQTVQTVFGAIMGVVGPILQELYSFIMEMIGIIITWVQENMPLIKETASTIFEGLKTVVETILGAIILFWNTWGEEIILYLTGVWDSIKIIIETALQFILDLITVIMLIINGHWSEAWEALVGAFKELWYGFKEYVQTALDTLTGLFSSIIPKLLEVGKAIVQAIWDGIKDKWGELESWFTDRLDDLAGLLPFSEPKRADSPLRGLPKAGESIAGNVLEGVQKAIPDLERAVSQGLGQVGDTINQFTWTVNTSAPSEPIIQDMDLAKAFVGG